jgi:hypothetical protein
MISFAAQNIIPFVSEILAALAAALVKDERS